MNSSFRKITLFELEILSELGKYDSLRGLARSKKLEAPHLTKILHRLEEKLQKTLLKRSAKGVILTPEGLKLIKLARNLLEMAEGLESPLAESETVLPEVISVSASRFIAAFLVAPVTQEIRSKYPHCRFRLLDMAPDEVVPAAIKSACEVVVSVGEPKLTKAWHTLPLGELSWGLYASRRNPIASSVSEKKVKTFPFLVPTYWKGDAFESGDDYCPLPWRQRVLGEETSSILTAIQVLRESPEQLAFAPRLVMRSPGVKEGIREIHVREWPKVVKPIYLAVREEAVKQTLHQALQAAFTSRLV